jgi:hypothetical protein
MQSENVSAGNPSLAPGVALFVAINVLGGAAVLGSYAWGLLSRPDSAAALWGGVPEAARSLYTVNMFLAAFGYFLFTPYFLRRLPAAPRVAGRPLLVVVSLCYAAILVASAAWLPLTAVMVTSPSPALWWIVRADLFAVAAGALGLVACVLLEEPAGSTRARVTAGVGLLPFCLQTVVLDALVWPAFFPAA